MSIDRLTALDRLMLGASRRWPQDIGALAILDGGPLLDGAGRFRLDAAREAIGRRLHLIPRFRQVILEPGRGLGGPLWVDAPQVDLTHHLRELRHEPPVGEAELVVAVQEILRQPLDPSRPRWEMWFLTGLPDQRIGLFVRIHHTIADGMAAMAIMRTLLDLAPDDVTPPPPWRPAPWPTTSALLLDGLRRRVAAVIDLLSRLARPRAAIRGVRAGWPAIRELLADRPADKTSLDCMVGPRRSIVLMRGSLRAVRRIARLHDATVNDVLLAISAGGLRQLLQHRGEPIQDTTIRIFVPMTLRRRLRGPQQGNLIAQMAVPLSLREPEPGHRLRQIAAETTARKARARSSLGTLMVGGRLGRQLILAAVMRQRVNATSASIPGPRRPLFLAGAQVLDVYPVLPLIANEPLGVGAVSYAGNLDIGITADSDAFPDLPVFVEGMRADLLRLGDASGQPVVLADRPTRARRMIASDVA